MVKPVTGPATAKPHQPPTSGNLTSLAKQPEETTMYRNRPTPDDERPCSRPALAAGARTGSAPGLGDPVSRRQLEKAVSWTSRERLRCLWYRLRPRDAGLPALRAWRVCLRAHRRLMAKERTETPMKRSATTRLAVSGLGLVALAALAAGCSSASAGGHATASPSGSSARLTVTTTLDGHTALPHRIHWQAFPSGPALDISEVDFLIDGHQLWAEHHTPYFYGDDGNYLVISFLTPGKHVFTVRAVGVAGQTARDSVTATVPAAAPPPAALAGTWKGFVKQGSPSSCSPGP